MFVEIFGTSNCKFCKMAKNLMESEAGESHTYAYTDVTDLEERANMNLRLKSPARSVPQIFADGKHIGGYKELEVALSVD
jgi:glutaredoxin 3